MPVSSLQSTDGGDNDMKFENSYDDDSTTNSHIIFGNSSIIDYRIASCFGYTCGMSIDNPGERYLGGNPRQCVCAYDIESATALMYYAVTMEASSVHQWCVAVDGTLRSAQ